MRSAALLCVVACLAWAPDRAGAQATPEVSPAETLLFETDHLARIKAPAVLVYAFRKVSNVEPGFSDEVRLDVAEKAGKTSATLHFLTGARRHEVPALREAHGNPVLLGFLERDIAEMKRLTGGSPSYFRKRIRMALAEDAHVTAQSIAYGGKTLQAQAVRIQPYRDDPLHARFEAYVRKTYTFIVSDQVPGGIYQLRSALDNGGQDRMAGAAVATEVATKLPGNEAAKEVGSAAGAAKEAGRAAGAGATLAVGARTVAGKAGAAPLPEIDETLTLVRVAPPGH
jgi:hypothetical protein